MKINMQAKEFYTYAYKLFDDVTPLEIDCGKLCQSACCKGDDDSGMYLFPGENVMFKGCGDNFKIEPSDFEIHGKSVDILLCAPYCSRGERPLACRIFPLVPYVHKNGKTEVKMDRRGYGMCPLVKTMDKSELDGRFVRRVEYLAMLMMKIPQLRTFLYEQSRLTDEICFL